MKKVSILLRRGGAAALACAGVLAATVALGAPCGEGAVTIGDTREDVAQKCGEPMFKEARTVKVTVYAPGSTPESSTTHVDEWTFAALAGEPLQTYRFIDGKVAEIASSGYGRLPDDTDSCRNGEALAVGDTSLQVYLTCGEPIAKEVMPDKVTETRSGGERRRTSVTVGEWTYRYGPELPGVAVRIENGTVTALRPRLWGK